MNFTNWWDASIAERLMLTLAHFLWQGLAVAAVTYIVSSATERSSARIRYSMFLTALLLVAICPVLTFCVLPETDSATRAVLPSGVLSDGASVGVMPPSLESHPVLGQPAREMPAAVSSQPASSWAAVSAGTTRRLWRMFVPYLTALYVVGVALLLGRLCLGLYGGWRLQAHSKPVFDPEWLAMLGRQVKALGLKCAPAIAFCEHVAVPTVIGVLRPTIVFPLTVATGLSTEEIEAVLAHELGHIRRWDHLVNIIQRVIEAILFFHPAVWWLSHQVRIEREHCCDDLVITLGAQPRVYLASLLNVAELGLRGGRPEGLQAIAALHATGRSSELGHRVRRLLGLHRREPVRLTLTGFASILATVMLTVVTSVIVSGPLGAANQPAESEKSTVAEGEPAVDGTTEKKAETQKAQDQSVRHEAVVVDAQTGEAIKGAHVTIQRTIFSQVGPTSYLAKTDHETDASGKFSFETPKIPGLGLSVFVDHESRASFTGTFDEISRIELGRADYLNGTLISADGKPVAGAKLLAASAASQKGSTSFSRAESQVDGTFRINVVQGGKNVLYIVPRDFAAKMVVTSVGRDFGNITFETGLVIDLAKKIVLEKGIVVSGQVLDVRGKPVEGVWVNASDPKASEEAREEVGLVPLLARSARTDREGRFTLPPLAGKEYQIKVERTRDGLTNQLERSHDLAQPMPAVFSDTLLKLESGVQPQPLRLQAVPHVKVSVQFVDAAGKPVAANLIAMTTARRAGWWTGHVDAGKTTCLVPHGLEDSVLLIFGSTDAAMRYRESKDGKWKGVGRDGSIRLGKLTDDIKTLEVLKSSGDAAAKGEK